MRVDEARGGEGEQAQYPLGGGRQPGVGEPEEACRRRALVALGAQLLGEVGDGGLGAGGQPAPREDQGEGLAGALLDEPFGGSRVDGDAHRPGEAAQQLQRGLRVEAAQGARPDVRDAGQGALGDGHDQAVGGAGQQGVDLLGGGHVVEQEQRPAVGEGLAQRLGEVVLGGAGGRGHLQGRQQLARRALGRDGRAVGLGEPGAQHPVPVTVRNLSYELLGERGAAGAGPARDEQHPRAGALRPERVSRPARSMSARSSFNSLVRPRN
ncbi:hypothetical protein SAV14893_061470 [Streptomyces avermitilis]|uniref:Uncharacterized protein n=1 Tax=Streptomyces avermitilis TaxID=33903 RepID=A0A4D4M4J6_STRAX|nr:hypothetical protein SAV14893_061470 [Streptomyces avermitilis]